MSWVWPQGPGFSHCLTGGAATLSMPPSSLFGVQERCWEQHTLQCWKMTMRQAGGGWPENQCEGQSRSLIGSHFSNKRAGLGPLGWPQLGSLQHYPVHGGALIVHSGTTSHSLARSQNWAWVVCCLSDAERNPLSFLLPSSLGATVPPSINTYQAVFILGIFSNKWSVYQKKDRHYKPHKGLFTLPLLRKCLSYVVLYIKLQGISDTSLLSRKRKTN